MYLMKAKKNFEQLDQKELHEKREKYVEQRVYSAMPETSKAADADSEVQLRRGPVGGSQAKPSTAFKPEDLPDGACFRPKSVVTNGQGDQTAIRTAEYIGSFSVQGNDQATRTEYVRKQLEQMRNATERKKVLLVISVTGIKVCSEDGESVYMAHALKRISYASCDPEHWQFSFLAREPKGHINVQFCHAFQLSTADEAEELNTIVGNAFKMAYAQQHSKQPTFHELIEQQLEEQKVRYQEFQEEAQKSLAKRLEEISTPTPFSEKAMQRMEMRRQSSGGSIEEAAFDGKEREAQLEKQSAKQKAWAKHLGRVKHKPGFFEGGPASPPASPPPPLMKLLSDPGPSPTTSLTESSSTQPDPARRHSQSPALGAATSSTEGFHAPSVAAIRESLQNQNNNSKNSKNKLKGSPVTALKETIDRQYNVDGSPGEQVDPKHSPHPPAVNVKFAPEPENYLYPVCHSHTKPSAPPEPQVNSHSPPQNRSSPPSTTHMMNRPLPEIPPDGIIRNNGVPRQRTSIQSNSSEEDVIPAYGPKTPQGQGHGKRHRDKHEKGSSPSHVIQGSPSHQKSKVTTVNGNGKSSVDIPWRETTRMNPANGHVHVNANVHVQNKRDSEPIYATRGTQTFGESKQDKAGVYGPRPSSVPTPQVIYGVKIGAPGSQLQEDIYDERYAIGPAASSSHPPRYQNDSPFHYHGSGDNSGASYETPVSPLRLDSLRNLDRSYIEDETLRHCSWYQPGIPREIALDILQQEEIGSFIVRDSTTHPGCYALSVKVPKFENPSGISHYLIRKSQRGVQLKGLDKEWPDLIALVTHHTVMPEMLPCTLRLPRNNKNPTFKASDKEDKEEDPDYQRLSDFSSMMAALKK